MKKRIVCIVSGRVQGVLYRAFTKEMANRLGIKGQVQNLDDGTVKVEAEGDEEKLREFQTTLNKGSVFSKVENVICENSDALISHDDFRINYRSFFDRF